MAKLDYDGTSEEYAGGGFEPIPAGRYQAVVVDSQFIPTKVGTGRYCKLQWQIVDGPHAGRVIFSQHNTHNQSQTAELIGRQELRAFAVAMGVEPFSDTEQLHGRPVMIRVAIEEKDGYAPKNVVKGAYPVGKPQTYEDRLEKAAVAARRASMSNGSTPSLNGGQTPAAHVAAAAGAGTFQATGARKPAASNTRANPFVE